MDKKYKKNFLKNVIFRIDFIENIDKITPESSSKIKEIFPIYEEIVNVKRNIMINETQDSIKKEKTVLYRFHKKDKSAFIEILDNSILISYNTYINFSAMKNDIDGTIKIVNDIENFNISRIGLRYINIFELEQIGHIDWKDYIESKYLIDYDFEIPLIQTISVLNLKADEYMVKIQHGVFNPNFPNEAIKENYIIDIDLFSNEISKFSEIDTSILAWNNIIQGIFEKFITEKTRKELLIEVENNSDNE